MGIKLTSCLRGASFAIRNPIFVEIRKSVTFVGYLIPNQLKNRTRTLQQGFVNHAAFEFDGAPAFGLRRFVRLDEPAASVDFFGRRGDFICSVRGRACKP
jgi:hypothetical protein